MKKILYVLQEQYFLFLLSGLSWKSITTQEIIDKSSTFSCVLPSYQCFLLTEVFMLHVIPMKPKMYAVLTVHSVLCLIPRYPTAVA